MSMTFTDKRIARLDHSHEAYIPSDDLFAQVISRNGDDITVAHPYRGVVTLSIETNRIAL